ncbi:copper homeostasis protein CutC [Robertkochia solimangrovi]|uniref:copper homeostasis protein CutC n=1 Tax=Robertkochia solimangrovi TaxID=2213046 RepID=UPI001180BC54|nr:copper homeostasis protein CutC [Robertkochia solimangrovi]TRZ46378.1 copper homeostasis protein CutC [Robertkochia solimangrovi]
MRTEICASSLRSAINAAEAGADRIELCSELLLGGVTPSYGMIREVVRKIDIPVYVLIRPRSGNFTYTAEELEIMRNDIRMCAELGCKGVVSGVLKKDHTIDSVATAGLMEAAGEMDFTFHRGFDWTPDQKDAATRLVNIGCKRVLSSGGMPSAHEGIDRLIFLDRIFMDTLTIMPGGGINERNIGAFKKAGFREIHFSASVMHRSDEAKPAISFMPQSLPDDQTFYFSDKEKIKRMVNLVK